MPILLEIEREMHPVKIRFGVGIGDISTQINREMAIGADGPGYYRARSALEWLKKNDKKKQAAEAEISVEAGEGNTETVEMFNTILSLMVTIKSICRTESFMRIEGRSSRWAQYFGKYEGAMFVECFALFLLAHFSCIMI